jgi:hypothetical protein
MTNTIEARYDAETDVGVMHDEGLGDTNSFARNCGAANPSLCRDALETLA